MHVLVVASEKLLSLALVEALELAGHIVIGPAVSSGEALLLCKDENLRCAIVDSDLEREGSGIELAQRLVAERDLNVVLTAPYPVRCEPDASDARRLVCASRDPKIIIGTIPIE